MDSHTCQYYLGIVGSKRIPAPIFSRLLKKFGSAKALVNLPRSHYQQQGFNNEQINLLKNEGSKDGPLEATEAALAWSEQPENHLLCYESAQYPPLLREIDAPPPLLFVRGYMGSLVRRHIALVGSRNASAYGKRSAYWMAREISKAGIQICSGLASGVDTKAHQGALDGNGRTIAVVGTGIDRIYPAKNAKLADKIIEDGALISEFPLGTPPLSRNFPRRNRVISGLCEGTLVVEATMKSGSLITARLAVEQNRDVFALPGPIGSLQSRGCHYLIKQGAKLVEEPSDILEEMGIDGTKTIPIRDPASSKVAVPNLDTKCGSTVLELIEDHGSLFESILAECQLQLQELHAQLMELEADGLIHQKGGRYYRSN